MIAEPEAQPIHSYYPPNVRLSDWVADQFRPGFKGYCVDVGASDGISTNSSYALEHIYRWTVLSVEANPYYADKLQETRGLYRMCAVAGEAQESALFHVHLDNLEAFSSLHPVEHPKYRDQMGERWATTKVSVTTLEKLLAEHSFPRLDALCLDTEGTERDILSGLDLGKWRPRVILLESWDQGALDDLLCPLGYERCFRSQENDGYLLRPNGVLG